MAEVFGFDKDGVRRTAETNRRVLGRRPDIEQVKRKPPPSDFFLMYGKANEAIAAPGMLSVSVWEGPQGEETDTGYDEDVYVYEAVDIAEGDEIRFGKSRFGYVAQVSSGGTTFAGARVWKDADTTIGSAAEVAISFNQQRFNVGGPFHDTSTNPTRLTAPVTAYYAIGASFRLTPGNTTETKGIGGSIRLNGTAANYISYTSGYGARADSDNFEFNMHTIWKLNANDYVELAIYNQRTISIVCQSQPSGEKGSPEFWIQKLGT